MISNTKSGHFLGSFEGGPSQLCRLLNKHPIPKAVGQHGAKLALVQDAVESVILQRSQRFGFPREGISGLLQTSKPSFSLLLHEGTVAKP